VTSSLRGTRHFRTQTRGAPLQRYIKYLTPRQGLESTVKLVFHFCKQHVDSVISVFTGRRVCDCHNKDTLRKSLVLFMLSPTPGNQVEGMEFYIHRDEFRFSCKPYFLRSRAHLLRTHLCFSRLIFPHELVEDGRERGVYDWSTGEVTVYLPKKARLPALRRAAASRLSSISLLHVRHILAVMASIRRSAARSSPISTCSPSCSPSASADDPRRPRPLRPHRPLHNQSLSPGLLLPHQSRLHHPRRLRVAL